MVHAATCSPSDITEIDGIRVTSVPRTIADVARTVSFERAACIADLAARVHGVTTEQVLEVLDACLNHPRNRRARRVAEFMDGRSESIFESRTRVVLHKLGYTPLLQVRIADADGEFARLDFYLADIWTVLEADGRVKYGRLVPVGETPADVLWKEKLREDRVRATGVQFARITWADLDDPGRIDRLIKAAAQRAALSAPPTAIFTPTQHP